MEVKNEVGTVRDKDAVSGVEALLLDIFELNEEGRDVDDDARTNEVEALGINET